MKLKKLINSIFAIFGINIFQMSKVKVAKDGKTFKTQEGIFKTKYLRGVKESPTAGYNYHLTVYYSNSEFALRYSNEKEGKEDLKKLSNLVVETA